MNSFQKNSGNSLQQQKSNIHIDISFNFKTIIVGIFLPISDVIFVQNLAPSTHRIQSVQTCLRGLHTQTRLARSWYSRTDKRRRRSRSFRRVISPSCTPLVRGVALVICCNLVGTRWVSEMYRELKYRAENSVNFKARGETSSKKKGEKRQRLVVKLSTGLVIALYLRNSRVSIVCPRVNCGNRDWRPGYTGCRSRTTGSPADDSCLERLRRRICNANGSIIGGILYFDLWNIKEIFNFNWFYFSFNTICSNND